MGQYWHGAGPKVPAATGCTLCRSTAERSAVDRQLTGSTVGDSGSGGPCPPAPSAVCRALKKSKDVLHYLSSFSDSASMFRFPEEARGLPEGKAGGRPRPACPLAASTARLRSPPRQHQVHVAGAATSPSASQPQHRSSSEGRGALGLRQASGSEHPMGSCRALLVVPLWLVDAQGKALDLCTARVKLSGSAAKP